MCKAELMQMDEVMTFENAENPKEAIRRLMSEAKERRNALKLDFGEDITAKKKKPVQVKTQKTLKLGK